MVNTPFTNRKPCKPRFSTVVYTFRGLDAAAMEDAIAEVVVNACVAFARLVELGKTEFAFASVLARYGVAQFRNGRSVGNRLNIHDVLSKYAQQKKGIRVKRLDHYNEEEGQWVEAVVQDTRSSPVPDIVSFRLDFAEWLSWRALVTCFKSTCAISWARMNCNSASDLMKSNSPLFT